MTRVLAVAHFPPPVHGMATAVDRLVTRLEEHTPVRRVNIAAPRLDRGGTYHLVRVARVLRALGVLVRERPRTGTVFLSCDAGTGMLYTAMLTVAARGLGYAIHLQHHSYAYVAQSSPVLRLLVRLLGTRCEHLVTCPQMGEDFVARYPGARTRVVGVASGVALGGPPVHRDRGERLVLGFLGNVTREKGIDLALAAATAAGDAGVPVELRVAGPVVGQDAEHLLARAAATAPVPVAVLGPVTPAERDRFLDDLDVFLFPSRHVHESFGLVAAEAMARGIPVLAHRSGCLTAEAVGDGGVVTERGEDYVSASTAVLARWWDEPAALRTAGDMARRRASATIATSRRQLDRFCADLVSARTPPATGARTPPPVDGSVETSR